VADSWFVRRHAHRAERIEELPESVDLTFSRPPLAAPPAPYRMQVWRSKSCPPLPTAAKVGTAPMQLHHYVGRVEEWPSRQTPEVTVTLWQWPSGRELISTLSVRRHLKGARPPEGSFVRVWTWLELPGRDRRIAKIHVKVEEPKRW